MSKSAIHELARRLTAECSAAYALYLEAHYARAEVATNGRMLSVRGLGAGVTSWSLFSGAGRAARARAYASRELTDFWQAEPLVSREAFERNWLHGVGEIDALERYARRLDAARLARRQ